MNIKNLLGVIFISVALVSLVGCRKKTADNIPKITNQNKTWSIPNQNEVDQAVQKAKELYSKSKATGLNFADGPCLSNDLMPNWVADIVHNPRQNADNKKINQCPAYREGKAAHFVELDLDGNLVRTY